jgi:NADP-dependent 3-hydroxy acid dehydrogenase YdfG
MTQALVVGASSDIGCSVAVELAGCGFDVRLWAVTSHGWPTPSGCAGRSGRRRGPSSMSVTIPRSRRAAGRSGARPLGAVVYAAGVFDWAPADEADPAAWERVIRVNLTAAAVLARLALPALLRAAPSALVFLGSAAGHRTFAHNAAYVASKHGLVALARATFLDVRDRDVKVSVISPGLVAAGNGLHTETGSSRPQELLSPSDVAAAVRFVVTFPVRGCPTEIHLEPQRAP